MRACRHAHCLAINCGVGWGICGYPACKTGLDDHRQRMSSFIAYRLSSYLVSGLSCREYRTRLASSRQDCVTGKGKRWAGSDQISEVVTSALPSTEYPT